MPTHPPSGVSVIGVGIKAPGGNNPDDLWRSLVGMRSFATPFTDDRLGDGAGVLVGRVADFEAASYLSAVEVRRYDRAHHLAIAAAQDAVDCVTWPLPERERCAVVCGVGLGAATTYEAELAGLAARGPRGLSPTAIPVTMPSSTASLLSLRFGFTGPCLTVSGACASGALAIGEGAALIRSGRADLVLAGGVDSLLTYGALCGFRRLDALTRSLQPDQASRPFDVDRDGFLMSEGAGFVVLAAPDAGRPAFGSVAGYGTTADAHHLVAPAPDGDGALRCMRLALADAGVEPGRVNHVNAHGTSTVLNDRIEAAAIARLFAGQTPPVTAVKGTTGHMIGGSGAVEAIVVLWTLARDLVPPVAGLRTIDPQIEVDVVSTEARALGPGYGLTNSFGFGGVNASLVLAGPDAHVP